MCQSNAKQIAKCQLNCHMSIKCQSNVNQSAECKSNCPMSINCQSSVKCQSNANQMSIKTLPLLSTNPILHIHVYHNCVPTLLKTPISQVVVHCSAHRCDLIFKAVTDRLCVFSYTHRAVIWSNHEFRYSTHFRKLGQLPYQTLECRPPSLEATLCCLWAALSQCHDDEPRHHHLRQVLDLQELEVQEG